MMAIKNLYPNVKPFTEQKMYFGQWYEDGTEEERERIEIVKQLALWCPYIRIAIEIEIPSYCPGHDQSWIKKLAKAQITYAD